MASERKSQAIYDAVHEVLMKLRIDVRVGRVRGGDALEDRLATVQHAAAMAAVSAYRKPLRRKQERPSGLRWPQPNSCQHVDRTEEHDNRERCNGCGAVLCACCLGMIE